ncbi:hypothetical protein ASG43_21675 [Aureimonas sp. Leaf454]|uniref:DUF6894 family protein n=1 Tax=Aureimonas sp. Leaf454 TaxID=1736381 RepID=UPI0006F641C0|nr:hypothetical protein [Aureimonas sp. Leaf454]KQT50288.1 hypothetical protein ASG43_21675 [Aureimonas sp. Leaf454]
MRYFFHVRQHSALLKDDDGIELDGIDIVLQEATAGARDIMAERLKQGCPLDVNTTFEVHDEAGSVVLSLSFASVLLMSIKPIEPQIHAPQGRGKAATASSRRP